jgi:hypothetical protein
MESIFHSGDERRERIFLKGAIATRGREGYARLIRELWNDEDRYASPRRSSREKYEKDLNWKVWGERVQRVIESVFA